MATTIQPSRLRGRARSTGGRDAFRAWIAFANDHGIANQNIGSYYSISKAPGYLSSPDAIRATEELFQDLVITGALTLPTGMTLDDYDVSVERSPRSPHHVAMMLRERSTQRQVEIAADAARTLHSGSKMNAWQVRRVVIGLAKALETF